MHTNTFIRVSASLLVITFMMFAVGLFAAVPARAAVSDWQQGVTMVPNSTTDFSGTSFQESLRNLAATGASHVALVIPFYQSNTGSTDLAPGWNTPTDEALASAIDYAHSLGLKVTLKPHIEVYTGDWRAYINPGDRDTWFNNYGNWLVHWAQIGQAHNAEMMVVGIELVSMAADNMNSSNTQHWVDLIGKVRAVYSGSLTYSANSNDNGNDPFNNEKKYIGFWSSLDYVGLSTYYQLNSDGSVDGLKGAWDYWNKNDLTAFHDQVGKPIIFTEIGYRSLDNSYQDPWNWQRGGSYNASAQTNSYEALMSYWNDYPWIAGIYWWRWDINPGAGGEGNNDYMPQNKPAQDVLTKWFSGTGTTTLPVATSTPTTTPDTGTTTPETPATTTPDQSTSTPDTSSSTPDTSPSTPPTNPDQGSTTPETPPEVIPPPPQPEPRQTSSTRTGRIDQDGQRVRADRHTDFVGRGFGIEESVSVDLDGSTIGSAHADGGGNFSTGSMNAPSTPGTHTYTFTGQTSGITSSATIDVE
ncbi:hypothetical protein KW798_00035 [Candidatus Parcubacteria bacterium]|nr:hypothetical protein [Candidatus Parcubacteria bacterium]